MSRALVVVGVACFALGLIGCKSKTGGDKAEVQANAKKAENVAGKAYGGAGGKVDTSKVGK